MNGFRYHFDPELPTVEELAGYSTRTCRLDTCLRLEHPNFKLNTCSGCKSALYCSKICQRADWPLHKGNCQVTQKTLSNIKACKEPLTGTTYNSSMVSRMLLKWADAQEFPLHIGAIHALDLQNDPDNCLTKALYVIVKPIFNPQVKIPSHDKPSLRRSFAVVRLRVENFSNLLKQSCYRGSIQAVQEESTRQRNLSFGCPRIILTIVWCQQAGIYVSKTVSATDEIIAVAHNTQYRQGRDSWQEMLRTSLNRGVVDEFV